jgi:hypothetical protein
LSYYQVLNHILRYYIQYLKIWGVTFPVVLRPCIDRIGRRSLARGPHTPGSLCCLILCEGHAPPFQALPGGAWGLRRQIFCWVLSVAARVNFFAPLPATCFWVFSAFMFVYSPCFSGTICFCIAQILLKFLLARC